MADPLSPATRATKRNLLLASVVAISANAFNVSVDRIPVAGLSISFDDRLFAFLLLIVLIYFFCTFVLYYVIDIKNLEKTAHQGKVEERRERRLRAFPQRYEDRVIRDLQSLTGDYRIGMSMEYRADLERDPENASYILYTKEMPVSQINRMDAPQVTAILDERHAYWLHRFRTEMRREKIKASVPVIGMNVLYWLRNYILDGLLPVGVGMIALASLIGHYDLSWLQNYLPSFRTLPAYHS